MYKHILVPTDGSGLSLKAAKQAVALAKRLKARITAIYVIDPFMPPPVSESMVLATHGRIQEEYTKAMRKHAGEALADVRAAALAAKVECETLAVTDFQPSDGIVKAARDGKCDLIVMASHGHRGLARLMLGSQTQKVLAYANIPVLVCR